jgi:hypothetical protein
MLCYFVSKDLVGLICFHRCISNKITEVNYVKSSFDFDGLPKKFVGFFIV